MKKRMQTVFVSLLLGVILLAGCVGGPAPTLEVTRLAPQTMEVTRLVPQTAVITRTPKPTAIPYALDTGYYEGMVVITQYYTFLGHGLYKEAYGLLSSSAQRPQSLEEFVAACNVAFKDVEIVNIMPFYLDMALQGGHFEPDPENEKHFSVKIRAWGVGNMSGSKMNGDLQLIFMPLVREDGRWKINGFNTAPAFPSPSP